MHDTVTTYLTHDATKFKDSLLNYYISPISANVLNSFIVMLYRGKSLFKHFLCNIYEEFSNLLYKYFFFLNTLIIKLKLD